MPQSSKPKRSLVSPSRRNEGSKPKPRMTGSSTKRLPNPVNVARGQMRQARREVGTARANPRVQEAGIGSAAVRAAVSLVTKGKLPRRPPRASSLEEKMAFAKERTKAYDTARSRARDKAQTAKDKRIGKYRAKQDAARLRTETRVAKAKKKQEGIAREKRAAAQEAEQLRYEKMARARKMRGR